MSKNLVNKRLKAKISNWIKLKKKLSWCKAEKETCDVIFGAYVNGHSTEQWSLKSLCLLL